jgi:hypothetical protein
VPRDHAPIGLSHTCLDVDARNVDVVFHTPRRGTRGRPYRHPFFRVSHDTQRPESETGRGRMRAPGFSRRRPRSAQNQLL